MIILLIFLVLEFYVFKKKEKNREQLIAEIKVGYLYGIILIIVPFIILIFNLQVYNGQLKNLVLIFIECFIAGIIYIISVRKGLNYEKKRLNK
ncbi:MAG: hypothetical protein SOV85_10845 [Clostridium sp.]|uniref:hypothetical protein n=1 Tax=Clostridium sp. TaxID=1506 RepID=UPI002A75AC56|nr:hypothetical protein [Clostridium sp.]MDY2631828.1 hypothetical protein [Clostridium sp.]MDY4251949.1 hypothetical protein [Clostridium sp.]